MKKIIISVLILVVMNLTFAGRAGIVLGGKNTGPNARVGYAGTANIALTANFTEWSNVGSKPDLVTPGMTVGTANIAVSMDGQGLLGAIVINTVNRIITILPNGKIGIGLTTPDSELHVSGSITANTLYGDGANLRGVAKPLELINKTSDYTLTSSDLNSNKMFANSGAAGEVILTLPAGFANAETSFCVIAAQYLRVKASNSEVIRFYTNTGAANGYVRSNETGANWSVFWNGTQWVITSLVGSLKADE